MTHDRRSRFPGLDTGWARFDGPAGTQVVDRAIDAMSEWQRSGNNANSHGCFAAAHECDALSDRARTAVGRLLGAPADGVVFGSSATALVMHLARSVAPTLGPGDEIVCTRLDHDANVAPWLLAARDAGATVRLAPFDASTGRLDPQAVIDLIGARTRWVAITGASNAIGTVPDVAAVAAAAHERGALVAVDGVHLTPHARVDVAALGCDTYVTSAYKWYGPHGSALWMAPSVRDGLVPYKVRPAPDDGPERWQLGTPAYENLAGIEAAAAWLLDERMEGIVEHERRVFARLLDGLLGLGGVTVHGPHDVVDRAPTLALTVAGVHPDQVATTLAEQRVAVWSGNYYAVEVMSALGLGGTGGAVRAGVSCYTNDDDVDRLLAAVATLC